MSSNLASQDAFEAVREELLALEKELTTPPSKALPVVLIPGMCATPRLFGEQISSVSRFGPIVVADHTRHDSIAAIAKHILDEAPPRFALVGMSMGGYVALEIMRHAPERISKLALLNTSARPDTAQQTEMRRAQIAKAEAGDFDEILEQMLPRLVHPTHGDDQRLRGIVRSMANDTGADAFVRQQLATISRPDSRGDLSAFSCPTLVLAGEADALIPPDESAELAAGIPRAHLTVVPGAGHLTTLEQPERVTEALQDWLYA